MLDSETLGSTGVVFVVLYYFHLPSGSKADSLPAELRFSLLNCSIPCPLTLPLPTPHESVCMRGGAVYGRSQFSHGCPLVFSRVHNGHLIFGGILLFLSV